ncbi:MAG: UxaA family hydrolase [Candidatus Sumerlaeia bacterium]|nr:UxaA family hydrolase [Candidatus Sumerlaeia bacterium]
MRGWLRPDGRKGIRNVVAVAYTVECAHHVAREIAARFPAQSVHLIGFPGCFPNAYAVRMMECLCTHPNVGGAVLVSLGCESMDGRALAETLRRSGRPAAYIGIQDLGGTRKAIDAGIEHTAQIWNDIQTVPSVEMSAADLTVGLICGGSDAWSGVTANPAMGRASDRLVAEGGTAIFEESGELIGCEHVLAARAATPELGRALAAAIEKAARYYAVLGHGSFAPGNADGGLTTIEEKSLGAYSKSGSAMIMGLLKPGDRPLRSGLYFLDVVPDGEVRFGFPNISDNAEIAELIACGAQVILFSTGRGSVVGSAISPVIKVCSNPETCRRMSEDMDIDAGRILEGRATLESVGEEIYAALCAVAGGTPTASERLGHREFILTYKHFEWTSGCFDRGENRHANRSTDNQAMG